MDADETPTIIVHFLNDTRCDLVSIYRFNIPCEPDIASRDRSRISASAVGQIQPLRIAALILLAVGRVFCLMRAPQAWIEGVTQAVAEQVKA